jgi:hypothetical protein
LVMGQVEIKRWFNRMSRFEISQSINKLGVCCGVRSGNKLLTN